MNGGVIEGTCRTSTAGAYRCLCRARGTWTRPVTIGNVTTDSSGSRMDVRLYKCRRMRFLQELPGCSHGSAKGGMRAVATLVWRFRYRLMPISMTQATAGTAIAVFTLWVRLVR